jgi:hypothetical protein
VLVGQDLIRAAGERAQITQIEKYNSAVNTFRDKYGGIPGDLGISLANQFGFYIGTCTGATGYRNGDGILESANTQYNAAEITVVIYIGGETTYFWSDLSQSGLIPDTLPNNSSVIKDCGSPMGTSISPTTYFPFGQIGYSSSVYAYSYNGVNWFGLSSSLGPHDGTGWLDSSASIPVSIAYNLDKKVDDGNPTTGRVQAMYINGNTGPTINGIKTPPFAPSASSDNSTSCYNSSTNAYSISVNGGRGPNCALSFKFQ